MNPVSSSVGRGDPPGRPPGIVPADEPAARPYLTRRGFARAALLTVLGVLGALLARRSCEGRGACGSCTAHPNCSLPWKEARK